LDGSPNRRPKWAAVFCGLFAHAKIPKKATGQFAGQAPIFPAGEPSSCNFPRHIRLRRNITIWNYQIANF
jgi:hypothetical protein